MHIPRNYENPGEREIYHQVKQGLRRIHHNPMQSALTLD